MLRLCKKPPAIQGTICNAVCLAMLEGIRISTIVAMFFFVQYRGLDVTFNMASISLVVSPLPFVVSLGGFRLPIPRIFRHGPWSRKDEASESLLGHADATLNATVGEGPHYVCPPAEELLSQAERTSPNAIRIPRASMHSRLHSRRHAHACPLVSYCPPGAVVALSLTPVRPHAEQMR